jgi:hypothetical protein
MRGNLSKVQSVDQRMHLERGVGFRQLRTCRRRRPGQLWARTGKQWIDLFVPKCTNQSDVGSKGIFPI